MFSPCSTSESGGDYLARQYSDQFLTIFGVGPHIALSLSRRCRGFGSVGDRRASRGGSWRHHIKVTRTAARSSIPPEFKYADYGFRVATGGNFLLER